MPELPEVETTMRGLAGPLLDHRLKKVEVRAAKLRFPFPRDFAKRLTGAKVTGLTRRAKYILASLDSGETLLIHLGMSGRMVQAKAGTPPAKHDHVIFTTDKGIELRFHDPRRFGIMDLFPTAEVATHKLLKNIGPEPLPETMSKTLHSKAAEYLTPAMLGAAMATRKSPVKVLLLDQRVVAGLGNIYVSEALFGAKIRPTRTGGKVTKPELAKLVPAIRKVLEASIKAGGTSMRDYVQATGEMGHFQKQFNVYGREGLPCRVCGTPIKRLVQGGRASFYCPKCQK